MSNIHVWFRDGSCWLPYEHEYDEGPFHVVTVSMVRANRLAIINCNGTVKMEHHNEDALRRWCEDWNTRYAARIMAKGTAAEGLLNAQR